MPLVGDRKKINIGDFSKDPMYQYASRFCEAKNQIMQEARVDYTADPVNALLFKEAKSALRDFYMENAVVDDRNAIGAERYQDELDMMSEAFTNDVQAIQENCTASMANYNPLVGLSLPMHKYLMMNCVFAQAVPRFVAKSNSWTETMETRWMITPDGKRIDIANQQNLIYGAWKSANKPVEVNISLPEVRKVDILDEYFHVSRLSHNLSVATHISAIAVEQYVKTGDPIITIDGTGKVTESKAQSDGKAIAWIPRNAEFNPGYGEANRIIAQPIDIEVPKSATETELIHDFLSASQKENMFDIQSTGKIKAVKMEARYDASSRAIKTPRVEWDEKTTYVQIPEADGITIPITPEEVKDIGASYGINQVTKYMSMIKDVLNNVKDDDIKYELDKSFTQLDDDHKSAKTVDFAPRPGYYDTHLRWIQETFMNTLDQFVDGLITVLRDPNMEICVIGRPAILDMITPTEYTYQTSANVGPIEMDFSKTVVTNKKKCYKFISSDKLWGNDNLIVLLIPKNTNRIVYRVYDYQMYISSEIRDPENPTLPALTAFQRYKFFQYQPVQGRLFVANPSGLTEHLPNVDPIGPMYNNNDLSKVFAHYDKKTGQNVTTENKITE